LLRIQSKEEEDYDKVSQDNLKRILWVGRLGEREVSIGETFKIFAIATKEDLKIGSFERIPLDSIHSNIVSVKKG
jgi:hypothetical protein